MQVSWIPGIPTKLYYSEHQTQYILQASNVLDGNKEMTNKSKNADDSFQPDEEETANNRIQHRRYKIEIQEDDKINEDNLPDEGFLDSYDYDKNESAKNFAT